MTSNRARKIVAVLFKTEYLRPLKSLNASATADNVNLAGYYNFETIRSRRRRCCRNSFSSGLSLSYTTLSAARRHSRKTCRKLTPFSSPLLLPSRPLEIDVSPPFLRFGRRHRCTVPILFLPAGRRERANKRK